jgi:nitroimidazol reductase NimA-like FMN-containing flavoprotein (pyridoxamine 5'-phosphate oxidase superfamily)
MTTRLVPICEDECRRRLADRGVGRVAVSVGALPAVFPVNYALLDNDVVFRTRPGSTLDPPESGAVVAFEVDHVVTMSHIGWSVMIVGVAHRISDSATLRRASELPLEPWASGDRNVFVRIDSARVTGRELTVEALTAHPA